MTEYRDRIRNVSKAWEYVFRALLQKRKEKQESNAEGEKKNETSKRRNLIARCLGGMAICIGEFDDEEDDGGTGEPGGDATTMSCPDT